MTMQEEFEEWFVHNYSWFINNKHAGYTLEPARLGEIRYYAQDRANHDFRVWMASRQHHPTVLPQEENADPSPLLNIANEAIDACEEILVSRGFITARKK